ncbi:MAG: GTPase [Pseudomonadota bacterium]
MTEPATLVTLVTGGRANAREALIAAALEQAPDSAVILEGLADGAGALARWQAAPGGVRIVRIAPGCLCCAGNMILRVTLNRLLRQPPARLFISLADASHVAQLRLWLAGAPYAALLRLGPDRQADAVV